MTGGLSSKGTQAEPEPEVDRLVFLTPPPDAEVSERFPVEVALVDADGDVVPLSGIVIYARCSRRTRTARPTRS